MITYWMDILLWLYFIVSTFISIREWILTRRRIRHLDKAMQKMTTNQLLMFKELMKLKGPKKPDESGSK